MLQELYEYALSNQLAAQPGFKPKKLRAYVCLGLHGEFLGIDPAPDGEVYCPDMGSAAQGPSKCNVLVEKRQIPLSDEKPQKRAFFLSALEDAGRTLPQALILRQTLEQPEAVAQINAALDAQKVKPGDIIGFKVDGIALESLIGGWWPGFRSAQNEGKKKSARQRCLITGQLEEPLATVSKVSGLRSVGGHSSGDAMVCFDKDAFCSYGLRQAENACVSESAMAAVNAALNHLIAKAPVLAGARWVYWYKEALAPGEPDQLSMMFRNAEESEAEGDADAEADGGETEADAEDGDVDAQADETQAEADEPQAGSESDALTTALAEAAAKRLLESRRTGEKAPSLGQNIYYILPLSGAGGRVMVRGWQQGSYEELQTSMNAWWSDLALTAPGGNGMLRLPAIGKLNYRLLKPQNGGRSLNERMKELSGLEPRLIFAILNRNPLPDAAAARALQYIRSKMLDSGTDTVRREPIPDPVSCQLLKAWLIRKNSPNHKGGETHMQASCNPEYPETAYQCGRMMAVYAAIQTRAMGKNLGAGVIQRYYTSASTCPALVFGRLSQLSQHHLAKIESRGAAVYYENLLSEIAQKIGRQIPLTLDLRQQAEFALGYYQQRAAMFVKNNETENSETES